MSVSAPPKSFQREVTSRFGLVPNFFMSAPDAPEILERLWAFAVSAYFDNPIPSLFKERLFVYLSRFCEVRYCIIRHCAFLLGYGHSAGDPNAPIQTVEQAIRLLSRPTPWERGIDAVCAALEAQPATTDWPEPESALEDQLFSALTLTFVEARRADRARRAVRHVVGGQRYEHLMGLLAFIRTAHYWTLLHPDLPNEDDALALLEVNEELTRRLLNDPEASRCDLGQRLFAELEDLRGLHERQELERANAALAGEVEQKEVLLDEINHRIRNSLQIVSSVLNLQGAHLQNNEAKAALREASARVIAIAAVHERLYTGGDVRVVSLDGLLENLCGSIGEASGCEDIAVSLAPATAPTDMAIPVALIANELLTNAIKYGRPPFRVLLETSDGNIILTVTDAGAGATGKGLRSGLGSRLVKSLATQLGARLNTSHRADGYYIELIAPLRAITKG